MAVATLNFAVIANNNVNITLSILDINGNPVNLSVGYNEIKWEWFIPNMPVTKSTTANTLIVNSLNPLSITIPILDTDTIGAPQGYWPHECVIVDSSGNPITITNNDAMISPGLGFVRCQLTEQ